MKNTKSAPADESRMAQYRKHLDQLNAALKEKYSLPDIIGAEKQIAWATDIRTKFLDAFDRQRREIDPAIVNAVLSGILPQTESRWWIDHKDLSCAEYLIIAKTMAHIITNEPVQEIRGISDDIITVDDSDPEKIFVSCAASIIPKNIMKQYGFVPDGSGTWVRQMLVEDNARVGVVESLCLTLLQNGFKMQILTPRKPSAPHDGEIKLINGELCIEASTEEIYRAAAHIGKRIIWLEGCAPKDIQTLIDSYDIVCSPEAAAFLGDGIRD